jgi:hypothetical protein
MDDAVRFVSERLLEHGADLRSAYKITGDRVPNQRQLNLRGYPGGQDIVGNWVNEQFQLDAFGEAPAAVRRRQRSASAILPVSLPCNGCR